MIKSKTSIIVLLFLSITVLLNSCTKDADEIDILDEENCTDLDLGEFKLLDDSINKLAYADQSKIIFVDSLGNEVEFTISESDVFEGESTSYRYDVCEIGDTVRYIYRGENKFFIINNDSLELNLRLWLDVEAYIQPEVRDSNYIADFLEIYCRTPDSQTTRRLVFSHIINARSWPEEESYVMPISDIEIYGKTFSNVLKMTYKTEITQVMFNYEFGIISFTDLRDKLWRFDRME